MPAPHNPLGQESTVVMTGGLVMVEKAESQRKTVMPAPVVSPRKISGLVATNDDGRS